MLHWLLHTDAGLFTRIAIGAAIFGVLAFVDFRKNGRSATRWREYGVLLIAVAAAVVYGAINDQITAMISWEYFYYGKELHRVLGDATPPEMSRLRWEAAKVGVRATWTAGLIFGVVLLIANNPLRGLPRLRNRELLRILPVILLFAIVCGAIGGVLGYYGALRHMAADFEDMWRTNYFRPRRFMCTWGVHLGGYVGGFLGAASAAIWIVRTRVRRGSRRRGS
ncbi:MAG TPA: hypothetical protein VLI90_14335 [Tepidisphaeraceae bacterium]|nr:hypothetical protein [Tepidisphaeraceae bacterium]